MGRHLHPNTFYVPLDCNMLACTCSMHACSLYACTVRTMSIVAAQFLTGKLLLEHACALWTLVKAVLTSTLAHMRVCKVDTALLAQRSVVRETLCKHEHTHAIASITWTAVAGFPTKRGACKPFRIPPCMRARLGASAGGRMCM